MSTQKSLSLLGRCVRSDTDDPMRSPILINKTESQMLHIHGKRPGRPRLRWIEEAVKTTFDKCKSQYTLDGTSLEHQSFNKVDQNQMKIIIRSAESRNSPFDRKVETNQTHQ